MLQQTQVASVIPYFERFLQRFPDLPSLASADEQEVLRLWEGLGYYRRARDLHRAAGILVADHAGQFPAAADVLGQLPGFGRYTVNAVLSQAFDQRLPILEANSQRVLCRLLGVRADPRQGAVQKALWQAARTLLPQRHVGRHNQALMELGALVCRPEQPDCSRCPLAEHCYARQHGLQAEIPLPPPRAAGVQVEEVAVVLRRRGRVLLVQRPPEGRWASMWEFPHLPVEFMEGHMASANRLLAELGLTGSVCGELLTLRHSVTRFHITMVCVEARFEGGRFMPGIYTQGAWLLPEELHDYPLSAPQRRLARRLAQPEGEARDGLVE
jgi:A/G-specific adenine glycosylase